MVQTRMVSPRPERRPRHAASEGYDRQGGAVGGEGGGFGNYLAKDFSDRDFHF